MTRPRRRRGSRRETSILGNMSSESRLGKYEPPQSPGSFDTVRSPISPAQLAAGLELGGPCANAAQFILIALALGARRGRGRGRRQTSVAHSSRRLRYRREEGRDARRHHPAHPPKPPSHPLHPLPLLPRSPETSARPYTRAAANAAPPALLYCSVRAASSSSAPYSSVGARAAPVSTSKVTPAICSARRVAGGRGARL
jgi:hypothetical protein